MEGKTSTNIKVTTRFIAVFWNQTRSISEVCLYIDNKTGTVPVPRGLLCHGCHKGMKAGREVSQVACSGPSGEFVYFLSHLPCVAVCEVGEDLTVGTALLPTILPTVLPTVVVQVVKSRGGKV